MWGLKGTLCWSAVLFLSPSSPTGPAATGSDCRGPTRLEAKGSGSCGGSESPGEALLTPAGSAIKDPCSYLGTPVHPLPQPLLPTGRVQKRQRRPESAEPECLSERECFTCSGHVPARLRWAERGLYLCSGLRDPAGVNPSTDPVSSQAGVHVEGRVLANP